jgi:hypothetical protein
MFKCPRGVGRLRIGLSCSVELSSLSISKEVTMPLEAMLIILVGVAAALITQGVVVLKQRRENPTVPTAAPAEPAPTDMSCCSNPAWVAELDVGAARGFDLMLGKCGTCGTPWINAFCVASSTGGYEPVKPADVEAMRAIKDPAELKQFMRRWVEYMA